MVKIVMNVLLNKAFHFCLTHLKCLAFLTNFDKDAYSDRKFLFHLDYTKFDT